MKRIRILAAAVVITVFSHGQTPVFQVVDTPLPRGFVTIDGVGDLDNDGDFDLLGAPGVALNDGHARFSPAPGAPLAFVRSNTIVADLNGDSFADVLSISNGSVRIDLGGGGLAFVGPVAGAPSAGAFFPVGIAVGDVDGDGDLDVLMGTLQSSGGNIVAGPASLWLNNGLAVFTPAPTGWFPTTSMSGTTLVALRDLDADGDPDAILAGYDATTVGSLRILMNSGGAFTPSQTLIWPTISAVEIANFNGDALPDIALAAVPAGGPVIAVLLNSPTGFLPPVITPFQPLAGALQAVDLNNDGFDELLQQTASPAVGVSVHTVGQSGSLTVAMQTWPDLVLIPGRGADVVRDLDGDQDRDVLAHSGTEMVELMNDGSGALVRVGGRMSGVTITGRLQVFDVDGDGNADLIGLGSPSSIVTGMNDGDAHFTGGASSPLGLPGAPIYYSLYAFDRDGDGDAHIYAARNVASVYGGAPADVIYDNVGGTFTPVGGITGTGSTSAFKAADFDGDGDLDIVLARRLPVSINNGIASPMVYLQNQGALGFAPPVTIGGNHATYDLEVGDFDGNGTMDVFQTNANAGTGPVQDECVLYRNSGSAVFTPLAQPGISGFFAASGDLNGDGIPDLVLDGQVFFNAGNGVMNSGPPLPSALVAPAILVDIDHDGALDLVETPATIMRNIGTGLFGPPESFLPRTPVAPTSWDIPETFVLDLDRDGDPDLVAPGPIILMNVTRQITHGSIPRPGRPASIDLYGTPNGSWALFASNGPAAFPLPPYGNILIDPASAQLAAVGVFTGQTSASPGTATLAVITPNNPALIGWTTYWEAADIATLRLTNRLTITVMGY